MSGKVVFSWFALIFFLALFYFSLKIGLLESWRHPGLTDWRRATFEFNQKGCYDSLSHVLDSLLTQRSHRMTLNKTHDRQKKEYQTMVDGIRK